jgi:hypothetical protein
MNIKDVNMLDVRYHLVQKCDRSKLKGGVGKYYSNLFSLNNEIDEFILEMNFNKNEEYHIFKEPNGKQLAKNVDQLVMILTFILFQKEKDSFIVLTNFKNQIKGLNILNNENDIKLYLGFLIEFYDRINLVEIHEKIKKEKIIAYLCCC